MKYCFFRGRRPSVDLGRIRLSGVAGTVFVYTIVLRRYQRQVIPGDMSGVRSPRSMAALFMSASPSCSKVK
jgi:hypothetical protein